MDKKQYGSTLCGETCSGSMLVYLSCHGLYKMGRFLGLEHNSELFKQKTIILEKSQNGLPLPFSLCPFPINDFSVKEWEQSE